MPPVDEAVIIERAETVQPASLIAHSNVGDLQASIRSLVNERRELRDRLSCNGRVNKIGMRTEGRPGFKRDRGEFEGADDGNKEKRSRTSTTGASQPTVEVPAAAFPVEKRPNLQLDDSTVKRNRNLFGSLLGHLKKAKTVLDQEKSTKAAELHRTMEKQVSQKLDLEKRNLAELRRRDFQERQKRDLARMREVQMELQVKENDMLSISLQRHFNRMKSFIRTDTCPMIFWVPGVPNEKTGALQSETRCQIEKKLSLLVEKFAAENQIIRQSLQSLDTEMPNSGAEPDSGLPKERTEIRGVHPDLINDSDEDEDTSMNEQKEVSRAAVLDKCEMIESSSLDDSNKPSHDGETS